jgi:hypothetical protein
MAVWVILVCAVMASMAGGVMLAYMLCKALFATLRMHARSLSPAPVPAQAMQQTVAASS